MSWYHTAFRKLFFDYHSQETAEGLASAFDAEGWAERVASANAQAVSVITKCFYGWSLYRRGRYRYAHPHLPAGLDMVEAQVEALHRRGIRAIGYYHVFNSEPMARDFPDWRVRNARGEPQGHGHEMCVRGPMLEEYMLPHVEEIVTNYALDAVFFDGLRVGLVCHCPACRDRFSREVGGEAPNGPEGSQWASYVGWSLADYRRIRERVSEIIHRVRPEMIVSYNFVYSMRVPESVPGHVGALAADIFPEDQLFNGSYHARHWATSGLPFDIMNSAHLGWWGDWGCKPAVAMQHEVATAVANGGLTWIGYQMTHAFDVAPAVMAELGKTLAFVKEREALLEGAEPRACVAVLNSPDGYFTRGAVMMPDQTAQRGAHKLLMETGLPHHFIDENGILAHLDGRAAADRYPVIILSDQRRLRDDLVAALEGYVREGGGLLVTGRTGTLGGDFQPTGRFALSRLTGVEPTGQEVQPHCYLHVTDPALVEKRLPMPYLIDGEGLLVRAAADGVETLAELWRPYLRGDGKPLLTWSPPGGPTGHPAITFRRVGAGAVAYVAVDVFRAYHVKNVWPLKHALAALIRRLTPDFPVCLESPAWLEVALAEQTTAAGRRTLVHLVNHHGNRPVDKNNLCIETTLPVRDVVLTIRRDARPGRVALEPGGVTPEWSYDGSRVRVRVPEVRIHTAIVLEP